MTSILTLGEIEIAKEILVQLEKKEKAFQETNKQNFYHLIDPKGKKFNICDTPLLYDYYETIYKLLSDIELKNSNATDAKQVLSNCCNKPYLELADIAIFEKDYEFARHYAILTMDFLNKTKKSHFILPGETNVLSKYYKDFKHILYFKDFKPTTESISAFCNNLK